MLMENLELREQVFMKMGAVWIRPDPINRPNSYSWVMDNFEISIRLPDEEPAPRILPPIETTWEVTAKYLVPFMRGKGWSWDKQNSFGMTGHKEWFIWRETKNPIRAEIINDNIALAACEAFMEVSID